MIAEWTCCICRQFVVYKQQEQQQQSLVREKDLQIWPAGNCSRLPPPAAAAPLATVEQRVRRTQKLTTRCPLGAAVVESISKDSGSSGERPASDLGIIDHRSSAARSKNGFQLRRKTPSHDQIAILKSIRYFLLAARVVIARLLRQRQVFAAVPA